MAHLVKAAIEAVYSYFTINLLNIHLYPFNVIKLPHLDHKYCITPGVGVLDIASTNIAAKILNKTAFVSGNQLILLKGAKQFMGNKYSLSGGC